MESQNLERLIRNGWLEELIIKRILLPCSLTIHSTYIKELYFDFCLIKAHLLEHCKGTCQQRYFWNRYITFNPFSSVPHTLWEIIQSIKTDLHILLDHGSYCGGTPQLILKPIYTLHFLRSMVPLALKRVIGRTFYAPTVS